MPTPATRMPEAAVAGDDIRFRPYIKRNAATKPVTAMMICETRLSIVSRYAFFA